MPFTREELLQKAADRAADAQGVVRAFEVLEGGKPYTGDTLRARNDAIAERDNAMADVRKLMNG